MIPMSWLIWSHSGLNKQLDVMRFQSKHQAKRPMPSLLLAPPKTFRRTGFVWLTKQTMETPVSTGKIPKKTDP